MREIVLDTETTGLNPESGDRIVEIAALEIENRLPTGKYFQCYINPDGKEMNPEAERITGITNDFLADRPLFKDVLFDFLDFIKNDPLIIHNAKFDVKFLNYELNIFGSFGVEISMDRCVDTLEIARRQFPGSQVNLDALCKRFNVDNSKRDLHGALIDCELLAGVYMYLMGGPQGALFADNNSSTNTTQQNNNEHASNVIDLSQYKKRKWEVPESELSAHNDFINSSIKNFIWK